jgi:hypothetical protein
MREVLLTWLGELGTYVSPIVWVRAAQAAGVLSTLDFHPVYFKLIGSGAFSDDNLRMRQFAAVALDQAAQDSGTRDAVRAFLGHWRRRGDLPERWTTATALGYDIGLADIENTLNELRVLGTPDESLGPLDGPTSWDWDSMVEVVSTSLTGCWHSVRWTRSCPH